MKPDSFAAIGRYHTTRPHQCAVRSQRSVLAHMSGSWHLREGAEGYELVHYHPRFGECIRKVPMDIVRRMIDRNLICYENPHHQEHVWLTLTVDGELLHQRHQG